MFRATLCNSFCCSLLFQLVGPRCSVSDHSLQCTILLPSLMLVTLNCYWFLLFAHLFLSLLSSLVFIFGSSFSSFVCSCSDLDGCTNPTIGFCNNGFCKIPKHQTF